MSRTIRDQMLAAGVVVTSFSLFFMLLSFFVTLKVTKLTLLALALLGTVLFYKGLEPAIQRRIKNTLQMHWFEWWSASRLKKAWSRR